MFAVLVRAVLVAAAVVAIVLAVTRMHDDRACEATRDRITDALFHHRLPLKGLPGELRELTGACRGMTVVARVATVLTAAGHEREAIALARRATQDEPRNVWTWVALGQALERSDPTAASRAFSRAQALNPRARLPRAIQSGAA